MDFIMHCKRCGEKSKKKCSGCKSVAYCSTNCQIQDWTKSHHSECSKLKQQNSIDVEQFKKSKLQPNHRATDDNSINYKNIISDHDIIKCDIDDNSVVFEDNIKSSMKQIGLIFNKLSNDKEKTILDRMLTLKDLIDSSKQSLKEKEEELTPLQFTQFIDEQLLTDYNLEDNSITVKSENNELPSITTYDGIAKYWNGIDFSLFEQTSLENNVFRDLTLQFEKERLEYEKQYEVKLALPPGMLVNDGILESMIDNDLKNYADFVILLWKLASVPQRTALKLIIQELNPIITFIPDQLVLIARKYDNPDYIDFIVDLYGKNNLPIVLLEGRLSPMDGRLPRDTEFPNVLKKMIDLGWKSKSDELNWYNASHVKLLWDNEIKFINDPSRLLGVSGVLKDAKLLQEFIDEANSRRVSNSNDSQMQVDESNMPINFNKLPNSQALKIVAENFYADSVPVLINAGADPNKTFGSNKTALHIAASYDREEVGNDLNDDTGDYTQSAKTVEKLLENSKTNKVALDSDGNTPMHLVENPNIAQIMVSKLSIQQLNIENEKGQTPFDVLRDKIDDLEKDNARTNQQNSRLRRLNDTIEILAKKLGLTLKRTVKRKTRDDDDTDVENKRTKLVEAVLSEVINEKQSIEKDIERWEKDLKELEEELFETVKFKATQDNLLWLQLLNQSFSFERKINEFERFSTILDYDLVLDLLKEKDQSSVEKGSEGSKSLALKLIKFLPGGPFSNIFGLSYPIPTFLPFKNDFKLPDEALFKPNSLAYDLLQVSLDDQFNLFNEDEGKDFPELIVYERIIDTAFRFNAPFSNMMIKQARDYYATLDTDKSFEESLGASQHLLKSNFNTFRWIVNNTTISDDYAPILIDKVKSGLLFLSPKQNLERLRVIQDSLIFGQDLATFDFLSKDQPAFRKINNSEMTNSDNQSRTYTLLNLLFGELGTVLPFENIFLKTTNTNTSDTMNVNIFITLAKNMDIDWRQLLFPNLTFTHYPDLFSFVASAVGGKMDAILSNQDETKGQTALQVWAGNNNTSTAIFDRLLNLAVPEESESAKTFEPFNTRVLTTDKQRNIIHLAALNVGAGHNVLASIKKNFQSKFSAAMLDARDSDQNTPLHLAVSNVTDARKRVERLIALGAQLNLKNKDGNTVLHIAAATSLPATRVLLSNPNMDRTIANNDGKIARDLAKSKATMKEFELSVEEIQKKSKQNKRKIEEVTPEEEDEGVKRTRLIEQELALIFGQLKVVKF